MKHVEENSGALGRASFRRPEPDGHSTAYRYYVVFVLILVSMFNTIDKALIPVLAEPIKAEFQLSDSQLGLLVGLIFSISYSVAAMPISMLFDKVSRTRLLATLLALWSGLTVLTAFTTNYVTLVATRIGVAAAESGDSPGCMSIITDYFPKERRAFAMSLFYINNALGSMIAFAVGGYVASTYGWRAVFLVFGIPGVILALLLILTVAEPRRGTFDAPPPTEPERYSLLNVFATLVRIRPLLYLTLGVVAVVIAQSSLSGFVSSFLIRVHGLSIAEAGYLIAGSKGPAGIVGVLLGGIAADRLGRHGVASGPLIIAFPLALCAPMAIIGLMVPNAYVAAGFFGACNFLNFTYYGAAFATFMTMSPPHMRGALTGVLGLAGTLLGYGLGAPMAGGLSDLFHWLGSEHSLRWALSVTSCFFFLGSAFFVAASHSIRRHDWTAVT